MEGVLLIYKVVDLFAGAGGLSLGFMQTGEYDIKVAFENNSNMQETYHFNHPSVEVKGDVCSADYEEIQRKYGKIDVVIGGPPCQGFSNANRQKNTAISKNNMLVKQYIRAIIELQPQAFIMENVSMLKSDVHRFYLDRNDNQIIERYNIDVKETPLKLIEEDFAFEEAINIIQDTNLILQYLWTGLYYSELNVIYKASKNQLKLIKALENHKIKLKIIANEYLKNNNGENYNDDYIKFESCKAFKSILDYYDGKCKAVDIKQIIEPSIMIQRMLSKAKEIIDNNIIVDRYIDSDGISAVIHSFSVSDYLEKILGSDQNGYILNSKVLCAADYGAPQKRMRFVVIGIKKKISSVAALPNGKFDEDEYRTVRDAIEDIEDVEPITDINYDTGIALSHKDLHGLADKLRDTDVLKNHIITKTTDIAMERFRVLKQGQNFHSLDDSLKSNTYTDSSRTQNTIYLRLNYDEPCGTVVNVRKSMWIHPTKNRAVSVREAARLQTFPDSFVFCGSKDQQYQQVGNAVPPIMARSIAEKLAKLLKGK